MEKISVFNYEAYYLDYLEGNLDETDAALLMAFLKAHPECILEDTELPMFEDGGELVYSAKNDLKMVEGVEPITLDNYRDFMVFATEGIISEVKKEELLSFIALHGLENEMKKFEAVYFAPDSSIVFTDKASLKQTRTVVLWPYISAAAIAACLILFFTIWSNNVSEQNPVSNKTIANKIKEGGKKINNKVIPSNEEVVSIPVASNNETLSPIKREKIVQDNAVSAIKSNPTRPILGELSERNLEPITQRSFPEIQPEIVEVSPQDYASNGFTGMQNPIEPITKFVAEKTNTDVDFRRAKTTSQKPGGFYVKIGKFELSHKKH